MNYDQQNLMRRAREAHYEQSVPPPQTDTGQQKKDSEKKKKRRKLKSETAFLTQKEARWAANKVIRWGCVGLLGVSFVGTIMAWNGGWPATWGDLQLHAIPLGIVSQVVFTVLQWGYRDQVKHPFYFIPLIFDTAATFLGYLPIVNEGFIDQTSNASDFGWVSTVIAYVVLFLFSLLVALLPEHSLVDPQG